MKAYVFTEKGKIELQETPDIGLRADCAADRRAAILRPRYLSPCSSDVHTVFAGLGPRRKGLILGHEGLAEVVETGDLVQDFRPGELVAVSAVMPDTEDGTGHEQAPFSGAKLGRSQNGMWAERFYVPDADRNLAHIPDGVSPEQALMAVDVMATGFTAAEAAELREGQTVIVLGAGPIGLMAVAAARQKKAGLVIALGSPKRTACMRLAADCGADLVLSYRDGGVLLANAAGKAYLKRAEGWTSARHPAANSTKSRAVDRILDLTEDRGADCVLVCGGGEEALSQACDLARYGTGIVANVSYLEGEGSIRLPIFSLGRGMAGKTLRFAFCRGGRHKLEEMLKLIADGAVCDPGQLVTHRLFGSGAIPEALLMMREKPDGLIKVMVEFDGWDSGQTG